MATGMKVWLLAVGAGFVLMAALLLPVETPESREAVLRARYSDGRQLPEALRFGEIESQVILPREILARVDWLESLTAVLRDASINGEPSTVVQVPDEVARRGLPGERRPVTREITERWEQQLNAQVNSVRARGAAVDFGIFYHEVESSLQDPRWKTARRNEYLVGESNGRGYCIRNTISGSLPNASTGLGICAFVLQYGLPGSGVHDWLKSGSVERGERVYALHVPARNAARQGLRRTDLDGQPDETLAYVYNLRPRDWSLSLPLSRCIAGQIEACESYFIDPVDPSQDLPIRGGLSEAIPELLIPRNNAIVSRPEAAEQGILAQLEAEFGEERFARFWNSEGDVAVAFQQAFGLSAGEWMHKWAIQHLGYAAESNAGLGHGIQTIFFIFAALGVGVLRERKRKLA
jgi:hypothetical protein